MKATKVLAALVFLTFFALSTLAKADSTSFVFDTPGTTPPPGTGPWGTLTLNLNPNGTIALDVATSPGFLFDLLEFNSPAGTSISGVPTGWDIGSGCLLPWCFSEAVNHNPHGTSPFLSSMGNNILD